MENLKSSFISLFHYYFQIVCGQDHTLLLSTDGKVYACGLGSDGQTGIKYEMVIVKSLYIR